MFILPSNYIIYILDIFIFQLIVFNLTTQTLAKFQSPPKVSNAIMIPRSPKNIIINSEACDSSLPNGQPSKCSSDCLYRIFCKQGVPLGVPVKCPTGTYCNQSTLQCSSLTEDCITDYVAGTTNTEGCAPVGYTADPVDCRKMSYCDGKLVYGYYCYQGYVVNPLSFNCVPNTKGGICLGDYATVCSKNSLKNVKYNPSSTMYIYCGAGGPQLQNCKPTYSFDTTVNLCRFKCPGEGSYADVSDNSFFYRCYKGNNGFSYYVVTCTQGSRFDSNVGECLISS